MFDNVLHQDASSFIADDIMNGRLPRAILLSGPAAGGKLTCAFETARVLSCTGQNEYRQRGHWLCGCPSCRKNRELAHLNVLLAGPRDCSLEILAARKSLLQAACDNAPYCSAVRFLFIRAVRKLTMRFSQVLWEGDEKLSKIAPIVQSIDEQMEKLNPEKPLPDAGTLEKICGDIVKNCGKLESSFLYDSIPISLIRRASLWAHLKSAGGTKVFIIENVERMLENARNALLKILEEPPDDVLFILTTSIRGAVMPTILSRVRTYTFCERNPEQQREIVSRVFHARGPEAELSVVDYLQTFLPVSPAEIQKRAAEYFMSLMSGTVVRADSVAKSCNNFEPRVLFTIFLAGILDAARGNVFSAARSELCARLSACVRECFSNVSVYNSSPVSAIEKLTKDVASVRRRFLEE